MFNQKTDDLSAPLRPALFLDRDGTLIEDVGTLANPRQINLFPDVIPSLLKLQETYLLFVITNQSAEAKGKLTLSQEKKVNWALNETLAAAGVRIQQWYVCPHQQEDICSRIIPNPEWILQAQAAFNLDLTQSFVIGDRPSEVCIATEQGLFGLYLLTGQGGKHLADLALDIPVFHRFSDAAGWMLGHPNPKQDLDQKIEEGASAIRKGGVAAFPTETVYGLGADVFHPAAVKQIFKIKGRPQSNPLIAHIASREQVELLASSVPADAKTLMDAFWPGPLTLVLPKRDEVPDTVTGGLATVAIRMPAQPIARELIRRCGTPVAAPSANLFTCTSPTTAQHVKEQLGHQCPIIIDGGACRVGVESTVISFTGPVPLLLRPGGVTIEEMEQLIGPIKTLTPSAEKSTATESPGMMKNHYAPATKLFAFKQIPEAYTARPEIGLLLFRPSERVYAGTVEILSQSGDTKEAAANFFAALQRLDQLNLTEIVAEYAPDIELGRAINNRLSKAANGRIEQQHD
jgi:L-threonylcarbamoyladenylate synthase